MNPKQLTHVLALALCIAASVVMAQESLEIITLAGTGEAGGAGDGGLAIEAQLNEPLGVTFGLEGNVYFCDSANHAVRMIDRQTGLISTVVGVLGQAGYEGDEVKPAKQAKIFRPGRLRFDEFGALIFTELGNHVIRGADLQVGEVWLVAGSGVKGFNGDDDAFAGIVDFNQPQGFAFRSFDGRMFICDQGNHRVRSMDLITTYVGTYCGNGNAAGPEEGAIDFKSTTSIHGPIALEFDAKEELWIMLREGHRVIRIDNETRKIHTMAGTGEPGMSGNDGPAREAKLSAPEDFCFGPDGNVYIADTGNHSVRMIDLSVEPPLIRQIAGTGTAGNGPDGDALKCALSGVSGIFVHPKTGEILVSDRKTHKIRLIRRRS